MSLLENVCGRLLVVAAIALWSAGTLAVDAIHAHAMFRQWRAASFFTTEGMIIESKAEATAGDGAAREAKIRYEYFVEGRRYAAKRYRYAYLGAAGSEAETQRLVEAHPVGGRATIYFNPRNPAEALLYPGVSSGDFLIGLFLAPFNIAMVGMGGGVALALGGGWGLAPGGLRISERDAELRAQPPRIRSLSRAALAAFGVSLISTALVGVCAGFTAPPPTAVAAAWIAVAGAAGLAYVSAAADNRDLVIDRLRQTLSLPSASLLAPQTTICWCDIVAIRLHVQEIAGPAGEDRRKYSCRVRWTDEDGKIVETPWRLPADRQDAAQWVELAAHAVRKEGIYCPYLRAITSHATFLNSYVTTSCTAS